MISFLEVTQQLNRIDEIYLNKDESKKNLKEEYLITEATRNQLLAKSKSGDRYSNPVKGNRWTRKNLCKVASTVKDYNQIDMDNFWKNDTLNFGINIEGETSSYIVKVEFKNIILKIQRNIERNRNRLEISSIYDALVLALNSADVKVSCNCGDFKYRFKYYATQQGYNVGSEENREAKITNPNDSKGAACKHILAILNNLKWLRKIASVINNYANYCKDNMQYNYSRYIFPKLYGMSYNKAVQLTIDDYNEKGEIKDNLQSDESLINLANALGKVRGRIPKGTNKNPVSTKKNNEK